MIREKIDRIIYLQIREKSGNFVIVSKNLDATYKVEEFENISRIYSSCLKGKNTLSGNYFVLFSCGAICKGKNLLPSK